MPEPSEWTAEIDEEATGEFVWHAVLYMPDLHMVARFHGPWHRTRAECEDFIATHVIGATLIREEPPQ